MIDIGRNERCPCGSGRKYKHCCGAANRAAPKPPPLKDLVPGVRMKGGVRANPNGLGFIAIVHIWDNIECQGEPKEWRHPEVFSTEEAAMQYYKVNIRPGLEQMMSQLPKQ